MDAFLSSTLAIAIAEVGDKTQLLALLLAARFRQRGAIIAGIFIATLVNHALSAYLGQWLNDLIPALWYPYIIGGVFILLGLWLLVPDKEEPVATGIFRYGAFVSALVLFFIAEIADKTQVATVVLAAKYDNFTMVVMGSTLGMLIANVPVVFAGRWLLKRIPMTLIHYSACALFIGLGVATMVWG